MGLIVRHLSTEVNDMTAKGARLKVVGDISDFEVKIQALIRDAQEKTAHNDTITLTIAANYGGRWDVVQAVKSWQAAHPDKTFDALG